MAAFAHPDDEAFGSGGPLARCAAEGCDVYPVTATRGEAGQIAEPGLAIPANLPTVREQELHCACQVYSIPPPLFLDYVDGQLPIVHQGQAVGKLVHSIRCHATQIDPHSPFSETPDEVMHQPWFRSEHFILARSTVGWPEGLETDLFVRLQTLLTATVGGGRWN